MAKSDDILISVDERHAMSILNGEKTVELRRRAIRLAPESRVWIYSKIPRGYVEVLAIVDRVIADEPCSIWARYGNRSAIARCEFDEYFGDLELGYAILFKEVHRLKPILSLEDIRFRFSTFQPPQFFKRLTSGSPELKFFRSAVA